MSYLDTIIIDGHDVRALDYLTIGPGHMKLRGDGERRGDDDLIPGDDGEEANPLPLAKWIIVIPCRIRGANRGQRNDNLAAASALIGGWGNHGRVALERRTATGDANDYLAVFAPGRFITGLSPALMNDRTGQTQLQYYQMTAYWLDGDGHKVYT